MMNAGSRKRITKPGLTRGNESARDCTSSVHHSSFIIHHSYPLVFTLLATASCVLLLHRRAGGEVPLFEQEPYDLITLDKQNDSAVLKVMLLDLPGRRVPDPFPKGGKLEVRLLERRESTYEAPWHAIAGIELFNDLVLKKARELVQA